MKNLILFSVDKKVAAYLKNTFQKIIGHLVNISTISMEEGNFKPMHPDVVFLSGEFLRPKARALFPSTVIIAPKRVVVGQNLEKVVLLPPGHNVLIVNSPRKTSEETIESLNSLGLNHLNYIPFWRGRNIDFKKIKTAISPGMMHLCPKGIKNRIDIGPRTVSIGSFLHILQALDLDTEYLEKYSNEYHRMLLDSSKKLADSLMDAKRLKKHEEIIINEFDDGLIAVDHNNRINLVNKAAVKLFKMEKHKFDSRNINDILNNFDILDNTPATENLTAAQTSSNITHIYNINGEKTAVTRIPVSGNNIKSFIYTLRRIDTICKLEKEVRTKLVKKGYVTKYSFSDIWTKSKNIKNIIEKARRFAATGKSILITAESGMGKELFAHAIHQASPLRNGPFVAINFAGMVDNLIESELFGYEEGAFTGAKKGGKKGLFEQAREGTIFLDEIGDASLNVQSRLLRVLQEKEVLRVGGNSIIPVDIRIIAATNRDILKAVEKKQFRKDLLYRLNTFPIQIPPLRQHRQDILYILHKYLKTQYHIRKTISREAENYLLSYEWPGNIRELINVAEYIICTSEGSPEILLEHFPDTIMDNNNTKSTNTGHCGTEITDDNFIEIKNIFLVNGLSMDMLGRLLAIIKHRQGKLCGRNSLRKELSNFHYNVSEGKMKKILKLFQNAELVLTGRTKQGTAITKKGTAFLDHIDPDDSFK